MITREFLPCNQMPGCGANHNGLCVALDDMKFKTGVCPFYKSMEQCRREHNENYDRLVSLDRRDLIEKYNLRRTPDVGEQV